MNTKVLKSLRAKEVKCHRIATFSTIPLILMLVAFFACLIFELQVNGIAVAITVAVGVVLGIVTFVFGRKREEYEYLIEQQIISSIKEYIMVCGWSHKLCQIVYNQEKKECKIIFYESVVGRKMPKKIKAMVDKANKITGKNIKVRIS